MKKWLIAVIAAIFIVTLALSIIASGGHHEAGVAWWHHVPGFYIILGFVGCIVFILVAKWLGNNFLQYDDQYYEKR